MAAKRGIQYIPAIDGLRALAVIAVMFYHLGFSWIPGGFLGVDLFFVISGYVITRMLLDSIAQSGGLDLRGFYLARLRRLLPAPPATGAAFYDHHHCHRSWNMGARYDQTALD